MFSPSVRTGASIIGCVLIVGTVSAIANGFKDGAADLQERAYFLGEQSAQIDLEGLSAHCSALDILAESCKDGGGYACEKFDEAFNSFERAYGERSRTKCESDEKPLDPQLFCDEC